MPSDARRVRRHRQQFGHRPRDRRAPAGRRLAGHRHRPRRLPRSSTRASRRVHRRSDRGAERRARCVAGLDTPDAIVHAAGVMRTGAARRARAGRRRRDVAACTWTRPRDWPMRCCRAWRAAGRGRMVLIGSRVSRRHARAQPVRREQGGVRRAGAQLGRGGRGRGVTVNVVSPAATDTPMLVDPARAATQPASADRPSDPARRSRGAGRVPAVRRGRRDHRTGHPDLRRLVSAALTRKRCSPPSQSPARSTS